MKLKIIGPKMKSEAWVDQAVSVYSKKINPFIPLSIHEYKTSNSPREQAYKKKEYEEQQILKTVDSTKPFILLDEKGKTFSNSVEFSSAMNDWLESGWGGIQFVIGGAYGASEEIKAKAYQKISLSSLTFNHQLVMVIFLEQIYRGFTVLRNIPYHNE